MSAISFPDEKSKQAFLDAQGKLSSLSRQIGKLAQQNASSERESKHAEITLKELEQYSESTITYKSVGKIFMRQPLSGLKDQLVQKAAALSKESASYVRAAEKLKSDLVDTQDQVKELMALAKSQ